MVVRLIEAMGGPMPDDVAACLYAGLVTDTGRFQYQATTPETLRVAASLREHGFDHARLAQALYEDNAREYLPVAATALARVAYVPEADLVWTYLTQADLSDAGAHPADTDDLIDLIRTARDVDVAAVLKQQRDGRFKVSARSRGRHDLAAVAAAFGGGGHRLAAGYTSEHGPPAPSPGWSLRSKAIPSSVSDPEGLLLVDKPTGVTSHDVVDMVRRALGTRKVGHAGTLDPMASGLLILGVGRATRLLRFLGDLPKTYEGTARLGVRRRRSTRTARSRSERPVAASADDVRRRWPRSWGSMQRPPRTPRSRSAVASSTRRRARANGSKPRRARSGSSVRAPGDAGHRCRFPRRCSGGTYVRVLMADVGDALGCGAHLTRLRRIAIGPFSSTTPWLPGPRGAAAARARRGPPPRVDLEAEEAVAAGHGRVLGPAGIAGPYGVFAPEGRLIGIYRDDGPKARPRDDRGPRSRRGPELPGAGSAAASGRCRIPVSECATSVANAAEPRAIPVPSSTPATTSKNQWAFRYTRDSAMTKAKPAAIHSHLRRRSPGGKNASTSAIANAAPAVACPDGNE